MIDDTLLSILACPETKKDLELADEATVSKINQLIEEGKLVNNARETVEKKIDGASIPRPFMPDDFRPVVGHQAFRKVVNACFP